MPVDTTPQIHVDRDHDGVAVITLNREDKHNAISHEMELALDAALADLDTDGEVRAVVIRGAGSRAFSAGLDMTELRELPEFDHLVRFLDRAELMFRWSAYPKPLIAAVNGHAHGAGAILATCADIRIGCPATTFKFSAILGGLTNNTWQLPKLIGLPLALEYVLSGRLVGADEAHGAGLLNRLVPDEAVVDEAIALATAIAQHPPAAVTASKQLLRRSASIDFRDAFDAENAVSNGPLRPRNDDNPHLDWWQQRQAAREAHTGI